MNFDLSDEQKMLAEAARGLLTERSSYDRLRMLIDSGLDWDDALWSELATMGFLGANIPEEFGGVGLTELDLGVISEELGRANAAVPFFSSIVLAADAIRLAGSDEQKARWLPQLASGEAIGCLAYAEGAGDAHGNIEFRDGKLRGFKAPVADAGAAVIAIVILGNGSMAIVALDQPTVMLTRLESFDELRPHYRIDFDGALAEPMPVAGMVETLFDRAAVQAGFEGAGAAQACLEMARDYAMERQIFGRSLASYQAIKHKLAEIAIAIELARSNAYFGGWATANAPEELPGAAAAARLTAIAAFESAARENLQVHGGIGYTFEANCHFYYRRERTLALSLGNREYWSERLIAHTLSTQNKAA